MESIVTDQVLGSFLGRIEGLRPRIRRMILFGSHARGDHRPDSDYDILLVVENRTSSLRDALYDAVMDTLLAYGRLISLKIFVQAEYERLTKLGTPFMQRVHAEGVVIG
jgi:predicted nucleotidyltransferase